VCKLFWNSSSWTPHLWWGLEADASSSIATERGLTLVSPESSLFYANKKAMNGCTYCHNIILLFILLKWLAYVHLAFKVNALNEARGAMEKVGRVIDTLSAAATKPCLSFRIHTSQPGPKRWDKWVPEVFPWNILRITGLFVITPFDLDKSQIRNNSREHLHIANDYQLRHVSELSCLAWWNYGNGDE